MPMLQTDVIALVSSFIASILAGSVIGVDYGDASGTNLLDIQKRAWDTEALGIAVVNSLVRN